MRIAIGSDHAGFELKEDIKTYLQEEFSEIDVIDCGTYDTNSTSYAEYGVKVAKAILDRQAERGIAICGTGIGITITISRIKGLRTTLCHDAFSARMSRLHNNSNVLTMGGRIIGKGVARDMVKIWLETPFEGGRHQRRLDQVDELTRDLS